MKTKTIIVDRAHFTKYNNIIEAKGNPNWDHLMPATKEIIITAIENGDEHLNSIRLSAWDGIAHVVGWTSKNGEKKFKSLSEQVCALKHYAIFHFAGFIPEFKD